MGSNYTAKVQQNLIRKNYASAYNGCDHEEMCKWQQNIFSRIKQVVVSTKQRPLATESSVQHCVCFLENNDQVAAFKKSVRSGKL